MAKMQEFIMQVEELYDAGLSVEEIAKRLNVTVPLVHETIKWAQLEPDEPDELE
jgi:orotate phosphoribosyltransferase-like protein